MSIRDRDRDGRGDRVEGGKVSSRDNMDRLIP